MKLNYLCRTDEYQVIWFHDSFDFLPAVLRDADRRTYLIYSFSWYVSPQRLQRIFNNMATALAESGTAFLRPEQILFLLNSRQELDTAAALDAAYLVGLVNNTCFLDPELFKIVPEIAKIHAAVCNAKPLVFKRHWLSQDIQDKIFVTYEVREPDYGITKVVDLTQFAPSRLLSNISAAEVVAALNSAQIGLIFSEEEGACYASTEYLLCGLPVVSTESRGGRSEYYTPENSVIAAPNPKDVADAVRKIQSGLAAGDITSSAVRADAIRRAMAFRTTFLERLAELLASEADRDAAVERIRCLLPKHSKMLNYRNFFIPPG